MKIVRHNQLLIATYIGGPAHNLLGLDFNPDLLPYEQDLARGDTNDGVKIEDVSRQVQSAVTEFSGSGEARPEVVGIQYLSTDTPSETIYHALAMEILESLSRLDELETFEPTWFPR